jgi:hypothetical protein
MRNQPKSRHGDHQPMNWRQYQDEVATLFRAAGCDAKVEEVVEGARGKHKIDVYVTFKQYGMNAVWIVECKYWNRRVSKETVMALSGIVADCGADKGIIISKKGFQSGAVRAATKTNIILTSLEELTEYIADKTDEIEELHQRLQEAEEALLEYRCPDCDSEMVFRYGDVEEFACGYQTGGHFGTRPCPSSPKFPKIDDYELRIFALDEKESVWKYYCCALPKTDVARSVHLEHRSGRTPEEAREAVIEYYEYLTTPPGQEFRGKWIQRSGYPKPE